MIEIDIKKRFEESVQENTKLKRAIRDRDEKIHELEEHIELLKSLNKAMKLVNIVDDRISRL